MVDPGPDTLYEPRHEDAVGVVLDTMQQQGAVPADTDIVEIGHQVLTALGAQALLR